MGQLRERNSDIVVLLYKVNMMSLRLECSELVKANGSSLWWRLGFELMKSSSPQLLALGDIGRCTLIFKNLVRV